MHREGPGLAAGAAIALGLTLFTSAASADHGPGTSGGGLGTQSGETMQQGHVSFSLRLDETEFEPLDHQGIVRRTIKAGDFDVLDRSFLTTLSASIGVLDDLQVGLSIGYYNALRGRQASFDPDSGDVTIADVNPDGITDMWLNAKYRVYHGPIGSFALFAGVKFPTGRWHVRDSLGETVDPSATAGSGSFDGMAGIAFSRFLTKNLTIDASWQYTFRTEAHDFKVGDRIDFGVAVAYRFNENVKDFPQVSVFGETNVRYIFESEKDREADPNTGGAAWFLAGGVRVSPIEHFAVSLAPQVPVLQFLNGTQLRTWAKVSLEVTASF